MRMILLGTAFLAWAAAALSDSCVAIPLSSDMSRGFGLATTQDTISFGVAGNVFDTPARDGELLLFQALGRQQAPVAITRLHLPPSSGIEVVSSDTYIVAGLPGADSAIQTANVGILQRGSAAWAQGAPVERSGRVLIWERAQIQQSPLSIVSLSPARFAEFGAALAIEGTRLLVGAPQENKAGAAYIFDLAQPRVPPQRLTAPAGATHFGSSVAFWNDRLIVGAADYACCDGSVFSFRSTPDGWVQDRRLVNPRRGTQVSYGQSLVRGEGFIAIVGNGVDSGDGAPEPGAIDVYESPDLSTYTRLRPFDVAEGAAFGHAGSVAAIGERIVVNQHAAVLSFGKEAGRWVEKHRIAADKLGVASVNRIAVADGMLVYPDFKPSASKQGGAWRLCASSFQ